MFTSILNIITYKHKLRYDCVFDQYTRFFMPKLLTACALVMSWCYFNDQITCIKSNRNDIPSDFIQSACWITGFYIYNHNNIRKAGYYGIPQNIDYNGINKNGKKPIRDCGFYSNDLIISTRQSLPFKKF